MYSYASVKLLSCVRLFATPWTAAHQASCPSPAPTVYSNSCPLSWWCHPAISSSVVPFSSCPQSFPASGSFQMSQLFTSGGQSIGVSASASVLPMNIQDWSPLGWTGWISLLFKGLLRVFSNTTVQKHQFSFPDSSVAHASHVQFKPPASPVISAAKPLQIHPRFHPWWMSPTGLLLGWYWVTQRRRFRSSKEKPSHCDQHQWGILTSPCSKDDEWLKITSSEQSKLFFFPGRL